MSKHTKEPWGIYSRYPSMILDAQGNGIIDGGGDHDKHKANAERIVACVNALSGIDNPAEWVKRAKDVLEESK